MGDVGDMLTRTISQSITENIDTCALNTHLPSVMSTRYYEFGSFQIDKLNHALMRDGETIPLKPKVFDTLLLLVENRERVLDKDEMLRRLWPDTVVEESNLSQNVYLLRKALCEETQEERYIETTPKRGYRFVATVKEVEAADVQLIPDDLASPELGIENDSDKTLQTGRRLRISARAVLLSGIGLLGIGLVLYNWLASRPKSPESNAPIRSIAVLPFKPLGSENRDETLGFGMADTLITRLSNIKPIIVRPTSSVRRFASQTQDPLAAGRELKVDAVLDGSIQREGNQLRVTLRLISVKDGSFLWTHVVNEQIDDPFLVQDRIAEQVAEALVPQMSGEQKNLLAKRHTENAEAYRLYMMGRYHWSKTNTADWNKSIEYFNRAIEKDRGYALAYTGLADSYLSIVADSLLSKAEAIPKAKEAAMTALQLDDTLSEAHVSLGRIKALYDWDWPGAEREFQRAIELNANSGDAHREYAFYLTSIGRSEQAIAEAELARRLDPLTNVTNFQLAWALISAHRYDEAIEESRQVVETLPQAHYWMAVAYIGKGMNEEAIAECQRVLSISKDHSMAKASLAYAYAAQGKRDEAKKILKELKELLSQRQASPYHIAIIYSGLDDKDQTFAWLEEAYRERSRTLASGLKVNPTWNGIRSDRRFSDLLRRIGLPQ